MSCPRLVAIDRLPCISCSSSVTMAELLLVDHYGLVFIGRLQLVNCCRLVNLACSLWVGCYGLVTIV